jgi:hypothetical protein
MGWEWLGEEGWEYLDDIPTEVEAALSNLEQRWNLLMGTGIEEAKV